MTQKTDTPATAAHLATAIHTACQLTREHVVNKGLGAMGLVLSSGGSEHAALSALLYGTAAQQETPMLRRVTEALPEPLNSQVAGTLTELTTLTDMSAETQVLHLPRLLNAGSSAAAAALLLIDVASFVNDARQIGDQAATRYVVTPGSATTFRPTAANTNTAADIIRMYDGLARQLIKTPPPASTALGHRALTLLYSLDDPTVAELKAWYQTNVNDKPNPIYILAQTDTPDTSDTAPTPEVEAEPAQ